MKLLTPVASDSTEDLADWLELQALRSPEKQVSLENLVQVIRQTGSTDAVEGSDGDRGSEVSQGIAQDSFVEIENRKLACGVSRYPFSVEQGLLKLTGEPESSSYVMLLLMSATTPTSGHRGTAVLFERICSEAALGYLGGSGNGADAIRFGSPRKAPTAKLSQALEDLCLRLAEGGGCKDSSKAKHTGDNGLDIVAWRKFPDLKPGKLIAFGQCAGGDGNWQSKLAELDGRKFVQKWFRQMLDVDPVRFFFVPRRISRYDWQHAGIDGGILFDRCRIVACLPDLTNDLAGDCVKATQKLLHEAVHA